MSKTTDRKNIHIEEEYNLKLNMKISEMEDIIHKVKNLHGTDAKISPHYYEWNDEYSFIIEYDRLENDEEYNKRIEKAKKTAQTKKEARIKRQKKQKEYDLKQLATLLKKYPNYGGSDVTKS